MKLLKFRLAIDHVKTKALTNIFQHV